METEQQDQLNPKYRGKLYQLSAESAWEDTGTGFVNIVDGPEESKRLIFRNEDGDKLLRHDRPVFRKDAYQLQGEGERQTIIVWEDPETEKDWALSFQDADGAIEIFDMLQKAVEDEKRVLPFPKLENLEACSKFFRMVPPSQRERYATECINPKFLTHLRESFYSAEDLGAQESLNHIWTIIKGIFLLSNQKLTERYLSQDVFQDVFGMLEYDEGLPTNKRTAHRQVLDMQVTFNQVVQFEDAEILERIRLNYRLQYLKDIVLPRLLDDGAFVTLNQMVHANLAIILDYVMRNAQLFDALFAQIRQQDLQSLLFLQDICREAKKIPPLQRAGLYEKMVERNLFDVLTAFLSPSVEQRPRYLAIEVLLLSAMNDPAPLRRFFASEEEGRRLLGAVVQLMLHEANQGVQGQLFEMLKAAMDPTALEQRERDSSLDVWYERGGLEEVTASLLDDHRAETPPAMFGQQLAVELLAFAVMSHGYRSRMFVVSHGVAQKAIKLMHSQQRFLQMAPLRLFKAMIATKDDNYHRYLVKCNCFDQVFRNLEDSLRPPALGGGALVSATLELLEYIRIENIKVLVDHIATRHAKMLQDHSTRLKTFEGLLLKHQQNLEYEAFPPDKHAAGGPMPQGNSRIVRRRSPGREDSDDDEAYFESPDDDEEDASSSTPQDMALANSAHQSDGADAEDEHPGGLKGLLGSYPEDDDSPVPGQVVLEDSDAVQNVAENGGATGSTAQLPSEEEERPSDVVSDLVAEVVSAADEAPNAVGSPADEAPDLSDDEAPDAVVAADEATDVEVSAADEAPEAETATTSQAEVPNHQVPNHQVPNHHVPNHHVPAAAEQPAVAVDVPSNGPEAAPKSPPAAPTSPPKSPEATKVREAPSESAESNGTAQSLNHAPKRMRTSPSPDRAA